ncbi:MAG: hypothetical protein V3T70_09330, partial [Phycisphaerae bacterium]
MSIGTKRDSRILEIMLILVVLGMTALYCKLGTHKMVALHLFFLPVVLSGYFLGRSSTGILALLSALIVTVATVLSGSEFAIYDSVITVGLALTIWASVLGMTAIL